MPQAWVFLHKDFFFFFFFSESLPSHPPDYSYLLFAADPSVAAYPFFPSAAVLCHFTMHTLLAVHWSLLPHGAMHREGGGRAWQITREGKLKSRRATREKPTWEREGEKETSNERIKEWDRQKRGERCEGEKRGDQTPEWCSWPVRHRDGQINENRIIIRKEKWVQKEKGKQRGKTGTKTF